MLERDRRRAQTRKYAESIIRREWLDKNAKWAACPNHGRLYHHPQHDGFNTLYCNLCDTVWHARTNVTHP